MTVETYQKRAEQACKDAENEIQRRIQIANDQNEWNQLDEKLRMLGDQRTKIHIAKLREIRENPEVNKALDTLAAATTGLETEAKKLKAAAEALAQAVRVINAANRVVTALSPFS